MIDSSLLHAAIAGSALDYLRELFGQEVRRSGPDQWRVGRRGSLAIRIRDGRLVFYSHEEGAGGDAVALWQRQRGGSAGEALQAAAAWARIADDGAAPPRAARPRAAREAVRPERVAETAARMTEEQFTQAHGMMKRLGEDSVLCERIAKARGWRPETIRGLAIDGALGWSDGWAGYHHGALAFLYESGIKQRWRRERERMIRWFCGGPRSFWRGSLLPPSVGTVFITEGETDAISLIDAGAEEADDAFVVAVPNAGVVPQGIAELVAGRSVVLSLDTDSAGQAASEKLIPLIRPTAASIAIWKAPK